MKTNPAHHGRLCEIITRFIGAVLRRLHQLNMTESQLELMMYIHQCKTTHPTMSVLATHRDVSTAAITGAIDRLEKLGYIERIHGRHDRREIRVKLTRRGEEIVYEIMNLGATAIASNGESGVLAELFVPSEPAAKDELALATA